MRALRSLTLALAFASSAGSAQDVIPEQTIEVLVSIAPGAPSADDLVSYYEGPHLPPPPLQALAVGDPQFITYLMPMRPQGDFLANLQAHPDSAEAQLYRYVVVIYPRETNLAAPLAALRADPYVLAADVAPTGDFSTPAGPGSPELPSAQPAAAPTNDIAGLTSLLTTLLGAAWWAFRKR